MVRKLSTTLCTLAFALGALGLADTALAEAWTGCVTPGGTIIHMKQGDVPLKPCNKNQTVIHLTDEASKQNTNATYNHEVNCKALKSTGATATLLGELGCPVGTEQMPEGPMIRVTDVDPGPFTTVDCENDPSYSCIRVENAFVGRQFYVSNEGFDLNRTNTSGCPTACQSDDRCFGAWLESANAEIPKSPELVCHLYYRSDTLGAIENFCAGNRETCIAINLPLINPYWYREEVEQPAP
jgi:hypothetical protein